MNYSDVEEKSRLLGKINLEPLVGTFGEIQTNEIIITDERMEHILERHPEDYGLFSKYVVLTVTKPNIIIKDKKNVGTIFMIKKLSDTNINVVVRVALSTDKKGLKNSVMTFYRLRDKNMKKLMKKNEVLYNTE